MLVGCTSNKTIIQKPVIKNSLENDYLYSKYKDLVLYECYVDENGELVDFSCTYGEKILSQRSESLCESQIDYLKKIGYSQKQIDTFNVGDYDDIISGMLLNEDARINLRSDGLRENEYAKWTMLDFKNYYSKKLDAEGRCINQIIYTDEMKKRIKEIKLSKNDIEKLTDLGYTIPEMIAMSKKEKDVLVISGAWRPFGGSTADLLNMLPQNIALMTEKYHSIITKQQYGATVLNRPLEAYFLSSPNSDVKRKIVLTFAMHGYEGDSKNDGVYLAENAYHIMLYYAINPDKLHDTQLIIIPMVNPDGVYSPDSTVSYGRGQSLGIDMNRDFIISRFKAQESRYLRDLLLKEKPDLLIDFHGWYNGVYGDSTLARYFSDYMDLPQKDVMYGASQGYLIGYAKSIGIRSLLVEYNGIMDINCTNLILALNEIIGCE